MRRLLLFAAVPFALAACADNQPTAPAKLQADDPSASFGLSHGNRGALYLQTNNAAGNAVVVIARDADGTLGDVSMVSTGGLGTGGGLGNQGAVALSENGRHLYVVNAGSDEISIFRVTPFGLQHQGNVPSGGDQPISIALRGNLLYVLNDGTDPNVSGFLVDWFGGLHPLPGSARSLSTAVPDAAQVGISPDRRHLVVTEKATNTIVGWSLNFWGYASNRTLTPSSTATPFGFDFSGRNVLLVSEAAGGAPDASVTSSYRPGPGGWTAVSPSVATTETAACWVVVTPNGKYVYVTNAGSASVSGYRVAHNGAIELLDADGKTGNTGAGPIDAAISGNGRYLYTLDGGAGGISVFRIHADGSLDHLQDTSGLPAGVNGLAAR